MTGETSQEEPSMEEILASIRRIISEDGEEEEAPAAAEAEESTPADDAAPAESAAEQSAAESVSAAPDQGAGGDEVLELTEEVDADGNVVAAEAAEEPAPVFEASEPALEAVPEPPLAPETPLEPAQALMENVAEGAAASAFAALTSQMGPGQADSNTQQVMPGGRTIEDHVLEMLRPMLREWLDKHLPQMVQRLVQREIDRIIHRSDPV